MWSVLKDQYVLFGEWLWQRHSVSYSTLPQFFIAFDLMEKSTGKFLSNRKIREKLTNTGIEVVPVLFEGQAREDIDLNSFIKKSTFGTEIMEGVYLRFEDENYVIERCKYRRKGFIAGRENFHTTIENNKLAN